MQKTNYIISESELKSVVSYLGRKPYAEVAGLVNGLTQLPRVATADFEDEGPIGGGGSLPDPDKGKDKDKED